MLIQGPDFADRDLAGRPARSWYVRGTQPEQLAYMRRLASAYGRTLPIRQLAVRIAYDGAGATGKDHARQALAIANWVKSRIRYVNESTETMQTPPRTIVNGFGDCDDHTILVAALLDALGIANRIAGMRWRGDFRHVFPLAIVRSPRGARVLPLDTTLRQPVGTSPVAIAEAQGRRVDLVTT